MPTIAAYAYSVITDNMLKPGERYILEGKWGVVHIVCREDEIDEAIADLNALFKASRNGHGEEAK